MTAQSQRKTPIFQISTDSFIRSFGQARPGVTYK